MVDICGHLGNDGAIRVGKWMVELLGFGRYTLSVSIIMTRTRFLARISLDHLSDTHSFLPRKVWEVLYDLPGSTNSPQKLSMAYDYGVTYQCCLGTQSRLQIIARNITRRLINDTFQPPRQIPIVDPVQISGSEGSAFKANSTRSSCRIRRLSCQIPVSGLDDSTIKTDFQKIYLWRTLS